MSQKVQKVAHHRNGSNGNGFYVVTFKDSIEGNMVGVVFEGDDQWNVAILNVEKLAAGVIEFGENSWRAEDYAPFLRQAAQDYEAARMAVSSEEAEECQPE